MRRLVLAGLFLLAAPACSGDDGGTGGVEMAASQAFEPRTVTIAVGDTVTWNNGSGEHHTVTAEEDRIPEAAAYFASGGFESEAEANDELSAGLLGPGESFSHTFDTPGTYPYYCIPHRAAGMRATIVVEAEGG